MKNSLNNEKGATFSEVMLLVFVMAILSIIILSPSFYTQSKLAQAEDSELNFKLVESIEITALQDNLGASGNFYLGSGTVSSEMKYFYQIEKNGGYITQSIPSKNVVIYETKNNPKIEKYEVTLKETNFIIDFATKNGAKKTEYRVYVPHGSILHNYNVDLK